MAQTIPQVTPDQAAPDNLTDEQMREFIRSRQPDTLTDAQMRVLRGAPSFGQAEGIRGPLTWGEAGLATLKQVARQAPTILGMGYGAVKGGALGSVAGGPAGAFVGAIGGATLGGMGGEALTQLGEHAAPSVFGEPPKSSVEAISRIGQAGREGMMSEVLGAGVEKGAPLLKEVPIIGPIFERRLEPRVRQQLATLEREGIPYTAGDVKPGGAAQITENLMRGTLLGGGVMEKSDTAARRTLASYQERLLDNIRPFLTKEELGAQLQAGVDARRDSLFRSPGGVFDRLYKSMSQLYPVQIDTAYIRNQIAPIKRRVDKLLSEGRIPSAKSPETPSRFSALLSDLSSYGTVRRQTGVAADGTPIFGMVNKPISYADVWQDKQTVDSIIRSLGDDVMRTRAKGITKEIHTILDTAMQNAALNHSPAAAARIRQINASYAKAKQLLETESLVADIQQMDPERVAARFFQRESVTPPRELLSALPAAYRQRLKPAIGRRVLQDIFDQSSREIEGTTVASGRVLNKNFERAQPVLQEVLSPDQLAGVKEFIDAATRAQTSGAMLNPASGRQLLAYSQLGTAAALVGGLMFFGVPPTAGTAATVLGPALLSRALTNQGMARILAKGFEMTPARAQATGWTAKVTAMLTAEHERMEAEGRGLPPSPFQSIGSLPAPPVPAPPAR